MGDSFAGTLKGAVPPHNLEAEQAVLGSLLLHFNTDTLYTVQLYLREEDFYKVGHQTIFRALTSLFEKGEAVDILTLTEELRGVGALDQVGGASYIASLTSSVPSAANIEYYTKIVQECAIRRSLFFISQKIGQAAFDETQETGQIIEEAEKEIFDINNKKNSGSFRTARTIIPETMNSLEERISRKETYTGIPSGFSMLDDLSLGFQNSEMVIIGARPSIGKTAFALTMATNISLHQKIPCGFFTLEMPDTMLMERILAAETRTDSRRLRSASFLKSDEIHRIQDVAGQLYETELYIVDIPNIPLLELRAQARRMVRKHGVKVIFIDYIGLIMPEDQRIPRHEQIAVVSRSLKALARELNIPIVVLSQVGRQSEGKAPGLADLRESGAIEQDADMVLFLHRDRGLEEDDQPSDVNETDLIIAKNRNGPTERVGLVFFKKYVKFESAARNV